MVDKRYTTAFIEKVENHIQLYQWIADIRKGNISTLPLNRQYERKTIPQNIEMHIRLHLCRATAAICRNDFIQARNFLKPLIAEGKQFYRAPSYRIVRLVYLLIQAELDHYDRIESEIRSLKREIQNDRQNYRTEKLLFQFIQLYPLPAYEKSRQVLWIPLKKKIELLKTDPYERQLLKIFDFTAWIESRMTRQPFSDFIQYSQ